MNEQNNELEMIPESEDNKENLPEAQEITEIQDNTEENLTPVEVEPEIPVEAPAPTEQPEERPIWSFAAQVEADRAAAKKRGMRGALVYAIIMTCLFAVCFAVLALLLITDFGNKGSENSSNNDHVVVDSSNLVELVDSVKDGVVTVYTDKGFGTGFVYTNSGYIITNYHVIDGAKKITVICTDGRELEAKLIDGDELSDVAVIFVKNLGITRLPVGDSDKLRVGEDVIAIGTPNDIEYAGTVTKGIISGVKRKVRVYEEEGYLSKTMEMIQTDTTLNHGNSGGPLINMRGEVIGINTMKYYASDAGDTLYFSIPINDAVEIADDIIEDGKYSGDKGSSTQGVQLGIQCLTVYKGIEIEIDENTKFTPEADGVLVIMVNEGYSAYGKLNPLDIIVSFGGVETPTIEKMRAELFKHKVGDTVTIEVWRDGKIVTVDITL
ncbi:MAG: trypsin-like peptidase domain-containing protein [Clostridia bacterium]|nr:trypsin-like peptidase domain-containing protein [Clostridia bacterium]